MVRKVQGKGRGNKLGDKLGRGKRMRVGFCLECETTIREMNVNTQTMINKTKKRKRNLRGKRQKSMRIFNHMWRRSGYATANLSTFSHFRCWFSRLCGMPKRQWNVLKGDAKSTKLSFDCCDARGYTQNREDSVNWLSSLGKLETSFGLTMARD